MKISKNYCDSQEYHQAMVNQKSMRMRQCVSDDYHEQYVNQRVNNKFGVFWHFKSPFVKTFSK